MSTQSSEQPLRMTIQPKVIDHLGINMYASLPPVISELIANSWDADADNVWITIPLGDVTKNFEIIVKDDGSGMSYDELNNSYLQIGRNRRKYKKVGKEEVEERTPKKKRRILGRKGIGKLSVFGIAKNVEIKSVKGKLITEFEMDVDKIKSEQTVVYEPMILKNKQETTEDNGVTITLKNLKRKNKIDIDELRSGIARRFTFFGKDFEIYLNDKKITRDDRGIGDFEFKWSINESISDSNPDWKVKGAIYSTQGTIREEYNRGVALFVREKLVQEPTYFGATSGKEFAYSRLFGELDADFLDGKNDVISTNRSSINWESEEGQALKEWGKKIVTKISQEWSQKRVEKRVKIVTEKSEFKKWLEEDLSPIERKRVMRVLNAIVSNEETDEDKIISQATYVKDAFKYAAFQELADKIDEANPENAALVVSLFQEWEHLESKEMYRVMKGRIATIEKLKWYIDHGAKEVPTIHKYLKEFPWILHPRWTIVQDEVRYSKLLRKEFPESEKLLEDKRIDFICFGAHPGLIVVELKKPGKPIGKKELDQVRDYQIFLEGLKGTSPDHSYITVYGYLVCEDIQKSRDTAVRISKLEQNGIFVIRYSELLSIAEKIHGDMIEKYKELANLTKLK